MSATPLASQILQFASQYLFYTNCICIIGGLISNMLNILIFTRLKQFRQNRCIFYLIIESIFNLINEIFGIILTLVSLIYGENTVLFLIFWCKLRYIIFQATGLVSSSMICFGAIDQFCSTNCRIYLRQMCTIKLTYCFVLACVIISFCHSISYSFFAIIHELLGCTVSNPQLIQYGTYFYYPLVQGFLPIMIASLFSLLAYRNVRRVIRRQIPIERRRFDQQITAMVLIRVMLYVILLLPYTVYRVYALNIDIKQIGLLRSAIERLIQVVFYSIFGAIYAVNFYLFLAISSRYRRQVKYVLKKKYWRSIKEWCCRRRNQVRTELTTVSRDNSMFD